VEDGNFREDLYYRLNVIPIEIPPLRERKEDILPLVQHFNRKISERLNVKEKTFTDEAYEKLMNYKWTGNVRELQNLLERLIVLEDSEVIDASIIPEEFSHSNQTDRLNLEEIERKTIKKALELSNKDKNKAADLLGIHPSTLYRKIKKLNIKSVSQ
jgi:DNA-binding NtrC family response regulator